MYKDVDYLTSRRMSKIGQSDTKPELVVRKLAHSIGLSYRLNVKDLPGKPDLANKKKKYAIFVHGCYWHRHTGCKRSSMPTKNIKLWNEKFEKTIQRDKLCIEKLKAMGYKTLVIWECETQNLPTLAETLRKFKTHVYDL